jgi:hypothetical protein
MKWSAVLPTPTDPGELGHALEDVHPNCDLTPEQAQQFVAAKEAAAAIAASGVIGTGPVVVSMAGSANPGHVPGRDGATRDCVAISVIQASTPDQGEGS